MTTEFDQGRGIHTERGEATMRELRCMASEHIDPVENRCGGTKFRLSTDGKYVEAECQTCGMVRPMDELVNAEPPPQGEPQGEDDQ